MSDDQERDASSTRDAIEWAAKKERDDAARAGRKPPSQRESERAFREAIIKQERRRSRR
jgi:hypothetical protein